MSATSAPRVTLSLLLFVALAACASPSAWTHPDSDVAVATVEVDLAMRHYRAGRFQAAVEAFDRAKRLVSHRSLVWNTARAYEELGDVASAALHFQAFVRRYPTDSYAERAAAKLEALRPRVTGSGGP